MREVPGSAAGLRELRARALLNDVGAQLHSAEKHQRGDEDADGESEAGQAPARPADQGDDGEDEADGDDDVHAHPASEPQQSVTQWITRDQADEATA